MNNTIGFGIFLTGLILISIYFSISSTQEGYTNRAMIYAAKMREDQDKRDGLVFTHGKKPTSASTGLVVTPASTGLVITSGKTPEQTSFITKEITPVTTTKKQSGGGGRSDDDYYTPVDSSDVLTTNVTPTKKAPTTGLDLDLNNSAQINNTIKGDIASFNYDSLYNTDNMTPKYSFMNSSFMYKSYLMDDNDYLNEIYFNRNPLEMETVCKNMDKETCGLTSSCVYVGNDKCVPGNKRGPYTTYSDINLDYYYYRGKCYGNCPGQFNSKKTTGPAPTTSPIKTTGVTSAPTTSSIQTSGFTYIPTSSGVTPAPTTSGVTSAPTTSGVTPAPNTVSK